MRAKLDGGGHYGDYEVERVVQAELNPRATSSPPLRLSRAGF